MITAGITGGISERKSVVSELFRLHGIRYLMPIVRPTAERYRRSFAKSHRPFRKGSLCRRFSQPNNWLPHVWHDRRGGGVNAIVIHPGRHFRWCSYTKIIGCDDRSCSSQRVLYVARQVITVFAPKRPSGKGYQRDTLPGRVEERMKHQLLEERQWSGRIM